MVEESTEGKGNVVLVTAWGITEGKEETQLIDWLTKMMHHGKFLLHLEEKIPILVRDGQESGPRAIVRIESWGESWMKHVVYWSEIQEWVKEGQRLFPHLLLITSSPPLSNCFMDEGEFFNPIPEPPPNFLARD